MSSGPPFVVLKFGGTSVASADRWRTIASEARARLDAGLQPVVVCSAVAGISDKLVALAREAVGGDAQPLLTAVREVHAALARDLGVDDALVAEDLEELERLTRGAALVREASPRVEARILATGELLATRLGAAFLRAQGLACAFVDARECFTAADDPAVSETRRVLSAVVDDDVDLALQARFRSLGGVVLTQGFIASDASGNTVLLGRGGSDTSAALFAAKLSAVRCEIWTDVPGAFSANPRLVPQARLLRTLDYDEAQELASMGAKVLHPRSIPPCRRHRIPLHIRWTERPELAGTVIERADATPEPRVKAISHKTGVTLVSMETPGMWQQVGFLADVFACFKQRGISVDLLSTSEMNVTVSLDASANAIDGAALRALLADLSRLCKAELIGPCAAVSLVGQRIRAILHQIGPALSVFEEQRVHLVSQASSDLNLTFVVDESQAQRLTRALHALWFGTHVHAEGLGPTWRELYDGVETVDEAITPAFWSERRDALLRVAAEGTPVYVYDEETLDESVRALASMGSIDRVLYALKANPHEAVLRKAAAAGFGFECVSLGEIDAVRAAVPDLDVERILFTPNFASRAELQRGLELGVRVTVDALHPLERWAPLFAGKDIFVRVDPGRGHGHHAHVRTAGARSKFGVDTADLPALAALAQRAEARVVGVHAHAGSGVLDPAAWHEVAVVLLDALAHFPNARILDVGGGLGVPEKPGQVALDLAGLDAVLAEVRRARPDVRLWIEPGRFVIARAGALLTRVTQVKRKGASVFVGVDTGMNSLLRPALYGSYHEIVNLSKLTASRTLVADVVGPICESGDVLGFSRRLAPTDEGDVLLVGTAGAYGAVMSSSYNLRKPARETVLPARARVVPA